MDKQNTDLDNFDCQAERYALKPEGFMAASNEAVTISLLRIVANPTEIAFIED